MNDRFTGRTRPEEYEEYAAAMQRAQAFLGSPSEGDEREIAAVAEVLQTNGLEGELTRILDEGGIVRWRLRVVTQRGNIDLELDHSSDWKSELEEAGIL